MSVLLDFDKNISRFLSRLSESCHIIFAYWYTRVDDNKITLWLKVNIKTPDQMLDQYHNAIVLKRFDINYPYNDTN